MIDAKRNQSTTYRVSTTTIEDMHSLTIYPKSPQPVVKGTYRHDMLPEWMREGMRMLDVAGNDHEVPGVGRKTATAYWFESEVAPGKSPVVQRRLNDMEDWHETQKDSRMCPVGVDNEEDRA